MMKMSLKVLSCLCLLQAHTAVALRGQGQFGQQANQPAGLQVSPNTPSPLKPGAGSGDSSTEATAQILSSSCPLFSTQINKMQDQSLVVSSSLQMPATNGRDWSEPGEAQANCAYSIQITPPKGFQVVVLGSTLQGRAQVGLNDSLEVSVSAKSGDQTLSGALKLGAQGKKGFSVTTSGQPVVGTCAAPATVHVQSGYSLNIGANTFAEVESNASSSVSFVLEKCRETPPVPVAGTVLGQVTSVTHEGNELIFKGWMCVVGTPTPTSVILKMGPQFGQNLIYRGRTNQPSPEGVTEQCGDTRDINRGFDIRFSYNGLDLNGRQAAEDLRGQTIHFYGTRPGTPSTDIEFAQFFIRQDF